MLSFDPDKAFLALEEAAEEWTNAQYEADLLEDLKSVVLSEIMVSKGDISVNKAEILSKADPRYRTHVEGLAEAKRKANRAKARYKNLSALGDMRRSAEATLRSLKV